MGAIKALFRSWDNPRANVYRRDNDIPYSWGTAVNVQSMAFGNMGDNCGTGDLFHLSDVFSNLSLDFIVDLSSILIKLCTSFCCNCESLWYRKT